MKFYHQAKDNEDALREDVFLHITHKFKYRVMWELRFLEKEINKEGGQIHFTSKDEIETKGFSEELDRKIWTVIHKIDFTKW